jgi:hypothetical protein
MTVVKERYGPWDQKEVNSNRLGVNVYSNDETILQNDALSIGVCSPDTVNASLTTFIEIYACACEDSKQIAKSALAAIQKRLMECWNDPDSSNMRWGTFQYQGYQSDGDNNPLNLDGSYTVLIASYESQYKYRLSNPEKLIRSR